MSATAARNPALRARVARNLDCRIRELGLTNREVGEMLGVEAGHVSRWRNGRVEPTLGTLFELAGALFDGDIAALVSEVVRS